jgi:hypothetical protein
MMIKRRVMAALMLSTLTTLAHASTSVVVPGYANPWLAGMPNGTPASNGDSAPAQSPVQVTGLNLGAGGYLTFNGVTGATSYETTCPGPAAAGCYGADGDVTGTTFGTISRGQFGFPGENGISDTTVPIDALLGVFLDNSQPNLSPTPAGLNFSSTGFTIDFGILNPALKQVFFIGDGMTSGNVLQQFYVPTGATRLYLGTMDGFGWYNNNGALDVTVSSSVGAVPEPQTYALMIAGLGLIGFTARRRNKNAG